MSDAFNIPKRMTTSLFRFSFRHYNTLSLLNSHPSKHACDHSFNIINSSNKRNSSSNISPSSNSPLMISAPEFSVDYLIIGAGVVGLAIAERLSKRQGKSVLLVEKNSRFGEETSSRNSEVIHAGIYYPNDSLKTRLCIRGKQLLYSLLFSQNQDSSSTRINYTSSITTDSFVSDYIPSHPFILSSSTLSPPHQKLTIPFYRIGKWIVSRTDDQSSYLSSLHEKSRNIGVKTYFLSKEQQQLLEPNVKANEVLVSPTTGIFDSHSFMSWLEWMFRDKGGDLVVNSEVTNIIRGNYGSGDGYIVEISDADSVDRSLSSPSSTAPKTRVFSPVVVNVAGLYSDRIANMLLPPEHHYKLYYVKGHYFGYRDGGALKVQHLIYPVPPENLKSLGIHLTLDLNGKIRFGPDVLYINKPDDYKIDDKRRDIFFEAVRNYLPGIKKEGLYADYAGIRPKLSGLDEPFKDFVIKEEVEHGLKGFVNLSGIESPGLTSSLAIAEMVDNMLIDR
ncbi:10966_t:CDS:2 [Acaulospora morrowiae]|uniref:L-2-hydroxyglutarate dehydrogenase, mitochondrial n=1 Tax=Acaulospora morrowiae TaxID=94023 RepID=A0A9N9G509_9GLOM|nr:10966_t:CDS:2 [Acaulospora morrowiae]